MPQPLHHITGIAAPIPGHNIDTDVIMPKRFLRTITREGLAVGTLADLRFHADGTPQEHFVLNQTPWNNAVALIVGDNFGCGSSREHAVWGLYQLGIRALIGCSFAGIFYDNCRRNGLAAITLDAAERDQLLQLVSNPQQAEISIDIESELISCTSGEIPFQLPAAIRSDLLAGRDAIANTLGYAAQIQAFEQSYLNPKSR